MFLSKSSIARAFTGAVAAAILLLGPQRAANAQVLSTPGSRGQLVLDQLSGFRASAVSTTQVSGIGYGTPSVTFAAPIVFGMQKGSFDGVVGPGVGNGSTSVSTTTFGIAPSADYFVIDHLSIGGTIELLSTSATQEVTTNGRTVTTTLPTVTHLTLMPRVGWMFAVTDRFAIWPRLGLGYISQSAASDNSKAAFSGLLFNVDVGFLYRLNEVFFLKAAPDLALSAASKRSAETRNGGSTVTTSVDASMLNFSVLGGFGAILDL